MAAEWLRVAAQFGGPVGLSCRPLSLQRILTAYSGSSQIEGVAFIPGDHE